MKNFIIVADSHIDNNNASAFFAMLAEVAKSDYDIIFLGDIFELWLGLNRYEEEMHKDFLSWEAFHCNVDNCSTKKQLKCNCFLFCPI